MTKITVVGAGTIGLIYAYHLSQAGFAVKLLARGQAVARLKGQAGLRMVEVACQREGIFYPELTDEVSHDCELVFVAVKAAQLSAALSQILQANSHCTIVSLANAPGGISAFKAQAGNRFIAAFPGFGGGFSPPDQLRYCAIAEQPTTIARNAEQDQQRFQQLWDVLSMAGFKLKTEAYMDDWLKLHAAFITVLAGASARAGGVLALADQPDAVKTMALAMDQCFTWFKAHGVRIRPYKLRLIFSVMPRWIAVPLWQRLLRQTSFTTGLEPHVMAHFSEIQEFACQLEKMMPEPTTDQPRELRHLLAFIRAQPSEDLSLA